MKNTTIVDNFQKSVGYMYESLIIEEIKKKAEKELFELQNV
jgi:hypothetical protein